MSSLALEIDLALKRLDAPRAKRLERILRDSLALALGEETPADTKDSSPTRSRRDQFAYRFAPLASVPDRDLSEIVNENRGEA
jgi:hypothetical protein